VPRRAIELVGENGVLRWDYQRNRLELYSADTRQWRVEEGDPTYVRNQMYVDELRHFVETLRTCPGSPSLDGREGAAVLAVALAALRSAAEGRTIDFSFSDETTRGWLSSFKSPA
jgi:predicted dehydrogenase